MKRTRLLTMGLAAFVALIALVAVGCGSDDNNSSDSGTSSTASSGGELTATPGIDVAADDAIAAAVPADVKSGGLTVAADATYPPMEFYGKNDNSTIIGADADIAKALGQVMGVDAKLQNAPFDSILPGLSAGKYVLGMSSFTDTLERQQEVDFVDYAQAGTSFYASADSGVDPATIEDLCDHSVALEKGTTQADLAAEQAKKCSVDVQVLPDQNAANLAIASGRAEIGMADSPVAAYIVEQSDGKFTLGGSVGVAPYGIAYKKGSAIGQPLLDAVKALYDDGTMQKIFDYWQLPDAAIPTPAINGATE
jgi:polar amino acid transport system substrate-binding protein